MLHTTDTIASMFVPTLALSPVLVTALVVVFLLVCIAMILLILIQRPQGGGLSGAFGAGGGAGQTAFGTKTGDVLTIVTIAIFVLFLVMAIILNFAARPTVVASPEPVANEPGAEVPVVPADSEAAQDAEVPPVTDIDPNPVSDPGLDDGEPGAESDPAPEEGDGGTP